ncbi:MAG: adenylate/guanylate cyclase domain-containing protein [Gammaproteobacteria bacterium]|nr:adenylate/guanylate cyclase domain-containing protein [Gammaproteobacteria bacterium]
MGAHGPLEKPVLNSLDSLHAWQRFHFRLTLIYGGAVFLSLAMLGAVFYKTGVDNELHALQKRLLAVASSLAASIDDKEITAIPVDSAEITTFHKKLVKRFDYIANQDPDIKTIYVFRPTLEPTKLRFFVDYVKTGPTGNPGELYDATSLPVMLRGFTKPSVEEKPYVDEFGTTLSGYAPVLTKQGKSIALVGVDVDVSRISQIQSDILWTTLSVFGVAAFVIAVVSYVVARSVRQPLNQIIDAAGMIARGELETRIGMDRADEFGLMSRHFDNMAEGLQERDFIRETFGRYVSEGVAKTLLDHREQLELGGEERVVTVLFSDLRGYSTISEQLPPVQVVDMLNRYLGAMNVLIDTHSGCVIEFIGDAILAVFGAPNTVPDHSEKAVCCAIEMRKRLVELNKEWEKSGLSRYWKNCGMQELGARIGIHTGPVVAGNLGSRTRMKYAVIGDTVNVAARLEALNKELGTDILISADVYAHLPEELEPDIVDRDVHKVKGREQLVRVYSIS